jgi:predicted acyl esterase
VSWAVSPAFKIVARGYVLIIQDVRGRYTSEGEWYPFKHEQGYDPWNGQHRFLIATVRSE